MRNLLGVAALAALLMSGTALASEVERVPHGVVVTPDQGAAKRVRVLAYGDAAFRVRWERDFGSQREALRVVVERLGVPFILGLVGAV